MDSVCGFLSILGIDLGGCDLDGDGSCECWRPPGRLPASSSFRPADDSAASDIDSSVTGERMEYLERAAQQ